MLEELVQKKIWHAMLTKKSDSVYSGKLKV